MNIVGAYEAKTKLSEILSRVRQGESFTVTRKGEPVAIIAPVHLQKMDPESVVKRLKEARDGVKLSRKVSISGLRPTRSEP